MGSANELVNAQLSAGSDFINRLFIRSIKFIKKRLTVGDGFPTRRLCWGVGRRGVNGGRGVYVSHALIGC